MSALTRPMSLHRQTQLARMTTNQLLSKTGSILFFIRRAEAEIASEERELKEAIEDEDDLNETMTKRSLWRMRQSRSMLKKSYNDVVEALSHRGHVMPALP